MRTTYGLKNFRVFGDNGASFKMTPITILTGCNSSGKSSVVKSMLLIQSSIERASEEYFQRNKCNPAEYYLDFSEGSVNLKSFGSAVNRNADDKTMSISYTIQDFAFSYRVEILYKEKEEDIFNYGWLSGIKIYSADDELVLHADEMNGALRYKYLNMNNLYLIHTFIGFAWAAMVWYVDRQIDSTYDPMNEGIDDMEKYKLWTARKEALVAKLNGSKDGNLIAIVNAALEYYSKHQHLKSEHKMLLEHDLEPALDKLDQNQVLLYFPVLEHFHGIDKSDVRTVLENAETMEEVDDDDSFKKTASLIADAFEQSPYDSFLDYYRELENEELNDVGKTQQSAMNLQIGNYKTEFISAIKYFSGIRFDVYNNNLHWLSSHGDGVNLNTVYRFLAKWQFKEGNPRDYISECTSSSLIQSSQVLFEAYSEFMSLFLEGLLLPDTFSRLKYIGNFQSEVRRLYSFDDRSNNLGNTVRNYLTNRSKLETIQNSPYVRENKYRPGTFTNRWIKKLGIGRSLNIIEDEDNIGAKLYIRKDSDRRGYPLADEGYGISQLVTFLLHIENEIVLDKIASLERSSLEKGRSRPRAIPTLSLEEPEVSLHPSMQSQLADIFYDAYNNYDIHFIVETHSEYLIRRTQAIVAGYRTKAEFENKPFSVYYIGNGGEAYELEYTRSGRFNNSFGKGFFDEASRSNLEILKREKRMRNE